MSDATMIIKYWGVRGSIPSPLTPEQVQEKLCALVKKLTLDGGTEKLFGRDADPEKILNYVQALPPSISGTYGGDTSCVEVQARNSPLILFDAGTGIRNLGRVVLERLFAKNSLNPLNLDEEFKRDIHLFLSHYHWDHLQGFPFFGPGFIPGPMRVNMHFYGKKNTQQRLNEVLAGQQQCPNFPVVWDDMPCRKNFVELGRMETECIRVGESEVRYQELTHPDSVFGYSVQVGNKKFVYASDTEHKDNPDPRLLRLAQNANILYYDSQYLPEEYLGGVKGLTGAMTKFDWGHSTYEWGIKTALAGNVPTVVLGHHEPLRDDAGLEELLARACIFRDSQLSLPQNSGKTLEVVLARQGLEQRL